MQCYTEALHKRLVSAPVHAGCWKYIICSVLGKNEIMVYNMFSVLGKNTGH